MFKERKENIKKGILDAALKIAIAEGWQAVTIRRNADAIEYAIHLQFKLIMYVYNYRDDKIN